MSHGLEGSLKLELDGEEETVLLEDFYPVAGGTDGNNHILHHDEHDIDINVEINNGIAKVISVKHQNDDVEDFEIDT